MSDYCFYEGNLGQLRDCTNNVKDIKCFHIILCTKGSCSLSVNRQSVNMTENSSLMFIKSDSVFVLTGSDDSFFKILILQFDVFTAAVSRIGKNLVKIFTGRFMYSNNKLLSDAINSMFNILLYSKLNVSDQAAKIVAILQIRSLFVGLTDYSRHKSYGNFNVDEYSSGDERLKAFFSLLIDNIKTSREVLFYANEMHITPKYLGILIKKRANLTPKQMIDNLLIDRLKDELKTSEKDISHIADEFNFPNQSYFGRYFKKKTGMSPSVFRKKF